MTVVRIGIDVMGGDFAPLATIDGSLLALQSQKNIELFLIGDEAVIINELNKRKIDSNELNIIHAPENIEMGEHPTKALIKKPNSSISIGFQMLKKNEIDGFASAGNTGAMFVGGYMSVKPVLEFTSLHFFSNAKVRWRG